MQKTVLLGVTSGIAAYKSLELTKLLKDEGVNVFVIMTAHANEMVPISEFEKASGNPVAIDLFEKNFDYKDVLRNRRVDHIDLADNADLMAIVPATANCIAKLAHGIADDLLSTTTLAVTAPILLAPSMNVHMWQNPIVAENVTRLKEFGYQIIEPAEGMLACGYEGKGRLEDIRVIKKEIMDQLTKRTSLTNKKIIVTAGGTIEKIDEVRYITNKSSGKMGAALAEACFLRGADVFLLRAKNAVQPKFGIPEKTFETADELYELIQEELATSDMIFHTAAVSDFQLAESIVGKIPSEESVKLHLTPRIKISDNIKKLNPKIKLIVFKAEYGLTDEALLLEATSKLKESKADAVVANDISKQDRGFQADTNEVIVVTKSGSHKKIPLASKREIAGEIVDYISND
jgi:phosphopantothenoylcysteine decarboxylase / phosphopantothenate---cysteine ligase